MQFIYRYISVPSFFQITQGTRRAEIGQEASSSGNSAHRVMDQGDLLLVLCALLAPVYNFKPITRELLKIVWMRSISFF